MGTVPTTPTLTSTLSPLGTQKSPTQTNPSGTVPTSTANTANTSTAVDTIGLQEAYGSSTGAALGSALGGLGTITSNAVSATNAAAEITGQQGFDSLKGQEAAAGLSPNSSSAALQGSDYWNQFDTNLNATDAQMELGESQTLIQALETAGQAHGADESSFSKVSDTASPIITGLAAFA